MSLSPRQRGVRRNFRRRHDDDDDFTDKVFFGWSFFFVQMIRTLNVKRRLDIVS